MPEIEFTIEPATGKLTTHIKGIAGPGCADVATLLKEFFGGPTAEQRTAEYFAQVQVRPQIRPKGSG